MRTFAGTTLIGPPFPVRVNGYAAAVGARSIHWAAELGLVSTLEAQRRLRRADAAGLAARICPAAQPEWLSLLTDLFTWLFAFDDNCDEDGLGADPGRLSPVLAGLLDVLDLAGGTASEALLKAVGPPGQGLHDLCTRVRAQRQPALLLRFTGQLREYLLALLWEAGNRQHHRVPGVDEYIQMRRHAGAVNPSFTLTDILHGALPAADRCVDPDLSTLDRLAADLVCWCNDLFSWDKERQVSWDKERQAGRDGHNLVAVIEVEAGQSEQLALAEAARRFNAGLDTYLELDSRLAAGADPEVARYLTVRRHWIRGTYDWSMRAGRYR